MGLDGHGRGIGIGMSLGDGVKDAWRQAWAIGPQRWGLAICTLHC